MIQIKSLFVFQSDVLNRSLLALKPIELLNSSRYSNRFRTVRTVRPVRTARAVRTVQTIWTSSNSSNYSDKFEHVRTLRVRFDQVRSRPCTSLVKDTFVMSMLNVYYVKTESKILLGVEYNVKLDLWSRQLMPSQSTERKKSWHSQTRLVCNWCCALVNSFLNRAVVTTCP